VSGSVVSVNLGRIAKLATPRGEVNSAIVKRPVNGPVSLVGNRLEGDSQGVRSVHGGPLKAVYAYAWEDYRWWETQLGRTLEPGTFGENLTTVGIDLNAALIGECWAIGDSAQLAITLPRDPCSRLAARMNDATFGATFAKALRRGPYLRIVVHGPIEAGDTIRVPSRPSHGITLEQASRVYLFERDRFAELLAETLENR